MTIPESWLEDLKHCVDLVELGTRHGVRWVRPNGAPKALCPFHNEDTPSFVAMQTPRLGSPRFHCYGACSRSWDAIAFVQERTGVGFLEAVRELAGAAGMEIPGACQTPGAEAHRSARQQRLEATRRALKLAQAYFVRALHAEQPAATRARAYVAERGLEEAVGPWGIGYAPETNGLHRWLLERHGLPEDVAIEAYLLRRGKRGMYPFHRDRLTFPVRDAQGRVLGHVGRSVNGQRPKYLNPGDVPGVYRKSETLFGVYEAQPTIRKKGQVLIVEGQISAITCHSFGFGNAVALGGTGFTEAQAQSLRGCGAREAVFLLDGDSAGAKAAESAIPVCLAAGLSARVAGLPQGLDPDDLLRRHP